MKVNAAPLPKAEFEIADAFASKKNAATKLSAVASKPRSKTADTRRNQDRRYEIKKDRIVVQNRREQGARRQRQGNGSRRDSIAQDRAALGA